MALDVEITVHLHGEEIYAFTLTAIVVGELSVRFEVPLDPVLVVGYQDIFRSEYQLTYEMATQRQMMG